MKFGKEFSTHLGKALPQWREKYLCYKPLKKLLKNIPPARGNIPFPSSANECFVGLLYEELEKFNDFYVEEEEKFIIRFQALKERIERLKEKGTNWIFSEDMMEMHKEFVLIHGEMVLLKSYSSLNFAGLIKILKKYDKRTGESLSVPFVQLALNQPFFITEPLSRLVHECESNLEGLFPIEPEVIDDSDTVFAQNQTAAAAESLPLGKENVEIYGRTVSAISTIHNLKKESKTINPLSMSYVFTNKDVNETMGSVIDEDV